MRKMTYVQRELETRDVHKKNLAFNRPILVAPRYVSMRGMPCGFFRLSVSFIFHLTFLPLLRHAQKALCATNIVLMEIHR